MHDASGLKMFFNEVFAGLHFCWVKGVDFGDFGNKVGAEFDGVVIRTMRRKLTMGFRREDIGKVFAPFRYDQFCHLGSLCNLGGDSGLVDQFSFQPSFSLMQPIGDFLIHIKT